MLFLSTLQWDCWLALQHIWILDNANTRRSTTKMRWSPPLRPRPAGIFTAVRGGGLGIAAMAYVGVDYLRYLSPSLHERLMPALWIGLALIAVSRVPFYKHWSAELRSALPFVAAMLFMLSALLFEALSVRFVTAVLGLDWHRYFTYIYTYSSQLRI